VDVPKWLYGEKKKESEKSGERKKSEKVMWTIVVTN